MKIDYSYNKNHQYLAFLPVPFIHGVRHLLLAFHTGFKHSVATRLAHLALGIFKIIPLINIPIALVDWFINRSPKILYIKGNTAFERGFSFGANLRKETQAMYATIKKTMTINHTFLELRKNYESYISADLKEEMNGLAQGAQVSYEDVLNIHTFLDIKAGEFGCSVLGTLADDKNLMRAITTNHSRINTDRAPLDSVERENLLNRAQIDCTDKSYKKALQAVSDSSSVQAIIFDSHKQTIQLATGWQQAPKNNWHKITTGFKPINSSKKTSSKLARNLDWPWLVCGSETVVVCVDSGKNKFVNVTWPGFLGVLSGMNEQGVSLASAQCGSNKQIGMPIALLFRKVLEETSTTKEALDYLEHSTPGSSMNLVIAAPDAIARVELNPTLKPQGIAHCQIETLP